MKTTLELPDDLIREIKIRAAQDNRRMKELVADLLRSGLASADRSPHGTTPRRVQFPLPYCSDPRAGEGITPEVAAAILQEQDEADALAAMRQ